MTKSSIYIGNVINFRHLMVRSKNAIGRCNTSTLREFDRPKIDKKAEIHVPFLDFSLYSTVNTWSGWSLWNKCSVTCGSGITARTLTCLSSTDCTGDSVDYGPCSMTECSVGEKIDNYLKCSKS